jgi:hypothetical protein
MAVTPTTRIAALAVTRAYIAGDREAGVLVLAQNGVTDRGPALDFALASASVSAQTLLASCGYSVERALAQLDQWMYEEQVKADATA